MDDPVFDLGEAHAAPDSLVREWEAALRRFGFLTLTAHGIPPEVLDACVAASRSFHRREGEWKERCAMALSAGNRGYIPDNFAAVSPGSPRVTRDYASLDFGPEPVGERSAFESILLGPNLWPDMAGFRQSVEAYHHAVEACALVVSRVLSRICGLDRDFLVAGGSDRRISLLRLLHYPEASREFGEPPNGHTDYEWFTLIWHSSPGLEVHGPDGRTRLVPAHPDRLVLLLGDLIEVLTGGLLESTLHWVRPRQPLRESLTYFYGPVFDETIAPTAPRRLSAPGSYPELHAGNHLTALRVRHFAHLKSAVRDGSLKLPFALPAVNPLKAAKMARLERLAGSSAR
jgi:isopenicillin N synthase-like dioxygenase